MVNQDLMSKYIESIISNLGAQFEKMNLMQNPMMHQPMIQ
jgi:hypothetical protein